MPRPRNEEIRGKIFTAFLKGFQHVGFQRATYDRIACELGMSKGLVQHYWPQKDQLAITFKERLLDDTVDVLHIQRTGKLPGAFADLYRIGQTFFAFLLQEGGYRQFIYDVLKTRYRTEAVIEFDLNWSLEFIGYHATDNPEDDLETTITYRFVMHQGGFYDLLFYCLEHDEPLDHNESFNIRAGLRDVAGAMMDAFGYEGDEIDEVLESGEMSDAELDVAIAALNERLLFS